MPCFEVSVTHTIDIVYRIHADTEVLASQDYHTGKYFCPCPCNSYLRKFATEEFRRLVARRGKPVVHNTTEVVCGCAACNTDDDDADDI